MHGFTTYINPMRGSELLAACRGIRAHTFSSGCVSCFSHPFHNHTESGPCLHPRPHPAAPRITAPHCRGGWGPNRSRGSGRNSRLCGKHSHRTPTHVPPLIGAQGVTWWQHVQDKDIKRLYPELARDMKVTLVEANEILASFDVTLREYTARHLQRSGVKLVKVPPVHTSQCRLGDLRRCATTCMVHHNLNMGTDSGL